MNKIPKIIHQIFFQGEAAIPENYRHYHQTVLAHHLDWQHYFWDETKSRMFIQEKYPWFLKTYDSYPYWIQRCDVIRYFLLHHYGGFYIDMDIECLKPIDDLLENFELILSKLVGFNNSIMGSIPGHPLWLEVFAELPKRQNQPPRKSMPYYVCYSTGPMLLNDCIVAGKLHENPTVRVCPGYIFEPDAPMEIDGRIIKQSSKEQSYTIHHMTTLWLPKHHQICSNIFQFFTKIYWAILSHFNPKIV